MVTRRQHLYAALGLIMVTIAALDAAEVAEVDLAQAQVVLTVAESKRLIAKGVAQMPIVKAALKSGIVSIAKGTTNGYVAEEILGKPLDKMSYTLGMVYPVGYQGTKRSKTRIEEITLIDGKIEESMGVEEAAEELKPGDVFIKGGNALDYRNKVAGVMIGAPNGGTTGKAMKYVIARKAHLIVPIGLEKLVYYDIRKISLMMRENVPSLNRVPSLWPLEGHIVTEIEALKILANVDATLVGAGGIGGAEGAVRLLLRGQKADVGKALKIVGDIQGEPEFVPSEYRKPRAKK